MSLSLVGAHDCLDSMHVCIYVMTNKTCVLKQNSGKLEKAEILEMTVQYLRALHSADFPRGREKGKEHE